MCIINGPIVSVGSTKIFAMPSTDFSRQLTVYRNTVNTPDSNLMCLPVPFPASVAFEKVPVTLFEQCADSFQTMELHAYRSIAPTWAPLTIVSHGSYEVVIVPTMHDLHRVPTGFGSLSPEVVALLQETYSVDYGVLLCRLVPGLTEYEPFAYSHRILMEGWGSKTFTQRQSGPPLFIPTLHYHLDEEGVSWDHEVYTIRTNPQGAHRSLLRIPKPKNAIQWATMPAAFQASQHRLHVLDLSGSNHPNQDLFLPVVQTSS